MTFTPRSAPDWMPANWMQANAALHDNCRKRLTQIVANPAWHGKFLNMLALLEHIGSRKIMLSQMYGGLDDELLKHLAEEARHAHFFRKAAARVLGSAANEFSAANTLCLPNAKMYFGRLDAGISQVISGGKISHASYLWVSLIIELRANWIYDIYQGVLQEQKSPLTLKSVIAEEHLHLQDMYTAVANDNPQAPVLLDQLAQQEARLFAHLWQAVENSSPL